MGVTELKWKRIALLIFSIGIPLLWTHHFRATTHDGIAMVDFGGIYYGARCAIHHEDAYLPAAVLHEFESDGGVFPKRDPDVAEISRIVITIGVNLPTALLLIAPLAMLPWGVAQILWVSLTVVLLLVAAYLGWSLAGDFAPVMTGCLISLMLINCMQLLSVGNVAGIAVSLCIIATWCFLENRYIAAGVVLFALSLALKPHDSGFVWLFFLLAGGDLRKRALQTLGVIALVGALAAIWIAPSSPRWFQELHENHVVVSQVGSTSDPAITGVTSGKIGSILDLQAALSVFVKEPRTYNLISYLVIGPLICFWAFFTSRRRVTREQSFLALAAISALTLLPLYHRPYDAKLLILALPAFALLWGRGGINRWLAGVFAFTAVLLTNDLPLGLVVVFSKALGISASLPPNKTVVVLLLPPVALLAMGSYFLWSYFRYVPKPMSEIIANATKMSVAVSTNAFFGTPEWEDESLKLTPHVVNDGVNR